MPPVERAVYREFTMQAQIDAEYNPSLPVADAAGAIRHFADQAERARTQLSCKIGVPYGPTLAETLDIFPADAPAGSSGSPVFIFIHGGYWRSLSAADFHGVALGLQPLGITTVVIDYALCPSVTLDEITRQARAAVAWTVRNIAGQGGDPSRIAIGGHSAGGHLAAMCLETRWTEDYGMPRDPLAGAVLVSGLYDLEPLRWSYLQPRIQLDDGIIRRNSPAFGVRPCATPVRITWGAKEQGEFARQSQLFHDAWQAAGNTSELVPQDGADHFTAIHGFEQSDSDICRWLAGVLGVAR